MHSDNDGEDNDGEGLTTAGYHAIFIKDADKSKMEL